MNKFLLMKERGDTISFSDILKDIPEDSVLRELLPNPNGADKKFITQRGMKVLKLRLDGFRQPEIAERLNMTPGQVAYVSAEIKNCLDMGIPSYIDIDIPALRKILRLEIKESSGYKCLSELLRDMPSDDELVRLFAERGNIVKTNIQRIPTHRDLQFLQLRSKGSSYESIGAEFHMDGKTVQHQISLTLNRISRDLKIEVDVPELYKPRNISSHQKQAPGSLQRPVEKNHSCYAGTKQSEEYMLFPITRDELELIIRVLRQHNQKNESDSSQKTRDELSVDTLFETKVIANLYSKAIIAISPLSPLEKFQQLFLPCEHGKNDTDS